MAIQSDHEFAPTQIARAVFPTAFRGYDQDAVRRYLSRLASALEHQQEYAGLGALEARTPAHERVEELETELETLRDEIKDLELELVQRSVDGDPASDGDDAKARNADAKAFDEHRAIELLGQETARVLESARSAAADILKRAETQAAALKAQAKSELADARKRAGALFAERKSETSQLVERLMADAEASAERITGEAAEHRAAVLEESSKILSESESLAESEQAEAERRAKQIVADAETLRQQVISELVAERRQTKGELDRMTAARDRLAMSLAVARSELDEVADALVDVSTVQFADPGSAHESASGGSIDLDALDALDALELAARDPASAAADSNDLDPNDLDPNDGGSDTTGGGGDASVGAERATAGAATVDVEAEPASPPAAGPATVGATRGAGEGSAPRPAGRAGGSAADAVESATTAAATDTVESATATTPIRDADADTDTDTDTATATKAGSAAKAESPAPEALTADSVELAAPPDPVDQGVGTEIDIDAEHEIDDDDVAGFESEFELDSAMNLDPDFGTGVEDLNRLPADGAALSLVEGFTTIELNDGDDTVEVDLSTADGQADESVRDNTPSPTPDRGQSTPDDVITTVASRTATSQPDRTRGDLLLDEVFTGRLPKEFAARDLALSRSGPNFRRQLRRALNDDQSEVLDRLRAGRGEIKVDELPGFGDQIDRYLAPLRRGLAEIAQAGARAGGRSDLSQTALDNLVRQLARYIVDKVRIPTIQALQETADHDRERILEPIRALYRDFRNVGLPDLTEDALYEAFAIGLYDSIDPEARIRWVVDPRSDPDPVCEINRQRHDVVKGQVFPSGHSRPLSLPGCRCLVTRASL